MKLDMYFAVLKVMGLVAACPEGWWLTWDKENIEPGLWASSLSCGSAECVTKPFALPGGHIEGLYQIKFSQT